jgi:hypothetical protein
MREITIIGAFLAGLLGLFMRLCGGGFCVVMAYDSVRTILRSSQHDQMVGCARVAGNSGRVRRMRCRLVLGLFQDHSP